MTSVCVYYTGDALASFFVEISFLVPFLRCCFSFISFGQVIMKVHTREKITIIVHRLNTKVKVMERLLEKILRLLQNRKDL